MSNDQTEIRAKGTVIKEGSTFKESLTLENLLDRLEMTRLRMLSAQGEQEITDQITWNQEARDEIIRRDERQKMKIAELETLLLAWKNQAIEFK